MAKAKRILFISNTRMRYTNILTSIYLSLIEMGYYVKDVDMTQHNDMTANPDGLMGGHGPIEVKFEFIHPQIEAFAPDMILFCAGGLVFSESVCKYVKQKGIILLGVTLSDPDVFRSTKNYASRFDYHTTNSKYALNEYKKLGINNTSYMPFAIDSRFFVPTEIVPQYKCDVTVIGHHQPSRLPITNELLKRFDTKIFGSRWPYENTFPVAFPEWLKVVRSGKIVVDFPKTRAGYTNVKVRLFEVAAAGVMLITEYLEETAEFFDFGKEIVGYTNTEEMYSKIDYYLKYPAEREKIARNAQLRCARDHMWQNRFNKLFNSIGF